MTDHFDFKAREIHGRFLAKVSDQQARLQSILAQLDGVPPPGALDELHQISHWLAGSAAMFGLRGISEAAYAVETEILSLRSSAVADCTVLRARCNCLLESIQASFARSPDSR